MTKAILSRPKDRSFESFKAWVSELADRLGAKKTLTDEELKKKWVQFWRGKKSD